MLFQMLLQNGESKYAFCAKISVEFLFLFYFQKQFIIGKKMNKNLKKKTHLQKDVGLVNGLDI